MAQVLMFLLFSASGALMASCSNMSIKYISERAALDGFDAIYSWKNNIRIMLWKGLNNDSLITCMLRSFDNWIMENNETGRVRCFKFTDVII